MCSQQPYYSGSNISANVPPPPFPGEALSEPLEYELQLERICQNLLESYKESQAWEAVGQVAQTLSQNKSRQNQLKQQIKDALKGAAYRDTISQSQQHQGSPPAGPITASTPDQQLGKELVDPLEVPSEVEGEGQIQAPVVNATKTNSGYLEPSTIEAAPSEAVNCLPLSSNTQPQPIIVHKEALVKIEAYQNTRQVHNSRDYSSEQYQGKGQVIDDNELDISGEHHSVEELDDITQMMESLADHFEDLSRKSAEQTPEPPVIEGDDSQSAKPQTFNGLASELEVPGAKRASYVSTDSSAQFYSPRESPLRDSEERDQFKDAVEDTYVEVPEAEATHCNAKCFSVTKTSLGTGDVYYVAIEGGASTELLGVANLEPLLKNSEDILDLRDLLGLVAKFPFHSSCQSAEDEDDEALEYEKFLNFVATSSERNSPFFVRFLQAEEEEETEDIPSDSELWVQSGK